MRWWLYYRIFSVSVEKIEILLRRINQLHDSKKTKFKYSFDSGSEYCWKYCLDKVRIVMLGETAPYHEADSTFGGVASNVQALDVFS